MGRCREKICFFPNQTPADGNERFQMKRRLGILIRTHRDKFV